MMMMTFVDKRDALLTAIACPLSSCELIVDPRIMFLDEPTSGLDSFTALNLIETLGALAASGRTIICTIHQVATSTRPTNWRSRRRCRVF